ncbi:MAG: hypothetical protein COB15_02720 [Flavobacteriales bacterium]|nr:MAG: hypothetical protein COB15_02720 [Flavobacteriales bacterium]
MRKQKLNNLNTHPNPTTASINIDLGEALNNVSFTLTNNLGQLILTKHFASTNFISLDIDAPKGIYFLQLQTENGE